MTAPNGAERRALGRYCPQALPRFRLESRQRRSLAVRRFSQPARPPPERAIPDHAQRQRCRGRTPETIQRHPNPADHSDQNGELEHGAVAHRVTAAHRVRVDRKGAAAAMGPEMPSWFGKPDWTSPGAKERLAQTLCITIPFVISAGLFRLVVGVDYYTSFIPATAFAALGWVGRQARKLHRESRLQGRSHLSQQGGLPVCFPVMRHAHASGARVHEVDGRLSP